MDVGDRIKSTERVSDDQGILVSVKAPVSIVIIPNQRSSAKSLGKKEAQKNRKTGSFGRGKEVRWTKTLRVMYERYSKLVC